MSNVNLYEMIFDCGRMGNLVGRFLSTPETIEALIGKELYFGEVLGKHSEVYGPFERDDFRMITDNQDFINMANEIGVSLESGYNPFEYYTCKECGDVMNPETNVCENCDYEVEE